MYPSSYVASPRVHRAHAVQSFKCGCPKSPPSPPSPPRPPPSPPRPPPPADSGFPFCRCSKRKLNVSPYRLAITSENYGLGTGGLGPDSQGVKYNQICFAVGPFARCNATTSPCCSMTVKKLELLIREWRTCMRAAPSSQSVGFANVRGMGAECAQPHTCLSAS